MPLNDPCIVVDLTHVVHDARQRLWVAASKPRLDQDLPFGEGYIVKASAL
jgi:hypothetical protein